MYLALIPAILIASLIVGILTHIWRKRQKQISLARSYKKKLNQWKDEGYDVSELKEKWSGNIASSIAPAFPAWGYPLLILALVSLAVGGWTAASGHFPPWATSSLAAIPTTTPTPSQTLESTTYQLSTYVEGQGNVSPSEGTFSKGEVITLSAMPALGWSFSHWGGQGSGTENPTSIIMDSNKTVYAYFTETASIPITTATQTNNPVGNTPPVIASVVAADPVVPPVGSTTVTCTATDPDGDTLTYTWSAPEGGSISGSGASVTWHAPSGEDTYTVEVTVSDGQGGTDDGSTNIVVVTVVTKPPAGQDSNWWWYDYEITSGNLIITYSMYNATLSTIDCLSEQAKAPDSRHCTVDFPNTDMTIYFSKEVTNNAYRTVKIDGESFVSDLFQALFAANWTDIVLYLGERQGGQFSYLDATGKLYVADDAGDVNVFVTDKNTEDRSYTLSGGCEAGDMIGDFPLFVHAVTQDQDILINMPMKMTTGYAYNDVIKTTCGTKECKINGHDATATGVAFNKGSGTVAPYVGTAGKIVMVATALNQRFLGVDLDFQGLLIMDLVPK